VFFLSSSLFFFFVSSAVSLFLSLLSLVFFLPILLSTLFTLPWPAAAAAKAGVWFTAFLFLPQLFLSLLVFFFSFLARFASVCASLDLKAP
jgi:hypothetical protein